MDKTRYRGVEIQQASGIPYKTLRYRAQKLGIKFSEGVSYEDVKRIVGYTRKKAGTQPRPNLVNQLRLQLKNDGFKVVEK